MSSSSPNPWLPRRRLDLTHLTQPSNNLLSRVNKLTRREQPMTNRITPPRNTLAAIVVLVGLEIVLIAILTAMGITGIPAVTTVVAFALAERIAYVRWFKKKTT